jgi:uncharacterized membrane protein (UPF0182 family)
LVTIPIGQSILYVEPLYLAADAGGLPTLIRVVVAYGDRIAMEPSLDAALRAIVEQGTTVPSNAPPPSQQ